MKELAGERIERLIELAQKEAKKRPERSRRYVSLARKLSSRYNVAIPAKWKRSICRKCDAFLVPGRNLTVRASPRSKAVLYVCKECGAMRRYGYAKRK